MINAPVRTMQHTDELERLIKIFRGIGATAVLEIGTAEGGTLYHWLHNAPAGSLVVSVEIAFDVVKSHLRLWYGWANSNGVELVSLRGNSHDLNTVGQVRNCGPFDFIFIDGDHSPDGVRQDFANYFPMLREGGCMAFHDICAESNGVGARLFWQELVNSGEYRTQEIKVNPPASTGGIGVLWSCDD